MPQDERTGEELAGEKVGEAVSTEVDVNAAEAAHAKELLEWVKKIERQTWPDGKKIGDICKKNRMYVKGQQHSDGGTGLVRANMIQANLRKSINRTYARNPQISIVPTEAVTSEEYPLFRALGKTAEIVVNHFLGKARIKKKAKAALRAAKTCRIGWIKVGLQKKLTEDVHIRTRMNDLQDNIQSLQRLKLEATHPAFNQVDDDRREAILLQRGQLMDSLQKEVEVIRAEGITLDTIKTEHMLIDVTQVQELDDYVQAERIGQKYFLSAKKAKERFAEKAVDLDLFKPDTKQTGATDEHTNDADAAKTSMIVHVYEIWDRTTLKVYTVGTGYDGYLRSPITPQEETGEQWYPYFPLATQRMDGQFWPQSDVELIMELQDEISASLTQFKEHRQKSIPFTIYTKAAMEDEEVKRVANPQGFEFIGVKGLPDQRLTDHLFNVEHNTIDPQVYSTEHLERKMEQVTGGAEASQPKSNRSKTFGEAKILTQETQTDSTSDQDEVEEWFGDLAMYVWQILMKVLTPQQVEKIAGSGAQWPDTNISLPQIYNQLRLKVIPGSSGKPDKAREREGLTKVMPVISEMILNIAELREKGQDDIAETQKIVLQEMLRRTDERFDVEEFFPDNEEEEKKKAEREQAAQQTAENEQKAVDLELGIKQSEIEKNNSEATRNKAMALQAVTPQQERQEDNGFEQIKLTEETSRLQRSDNLKAATDVQINRDKLTAAESLKREEFASNEKVAAIEAAADVRKAEIQAASKDKELVAKSNIEDKKIAGERETAKIQAKAQVKSSENTDSDKDSGKTTQELSKVVDQAKAAKGDEALGAIIKGLEAVIKTIGGEKKITFDAKGKPVGIKPVKPDNRTIN